MDAPAGDFPWATLLRGATQFVKEEHDTHEGAHVHSYVSFFFLFLALILGAFTLHVQSRFFPSLPYTCALLVEGVLFGGILKRVDPHHASLLGQSTQMWADIDPHLLLYVFLPALLFADSMALNWHLWKRCFGQCLLLAGPGVVVGALLQAAVARYVFPYEWSWTTCIMFGSILGATDPVAVVSILKDVGAPPALTMMVSGESLMNDGTAIVMFNLFAALTHNTPEALSEVGIPPGGGIDAAIVLQYFLVIAVGGAVLGIVVGAAAVFWIGFAKRKTSHSDNVIQMTVVICLPYTAFILGENAGVSGILAVVAAGLVVAACGWPQFTSRHSLEQVWHVIEYILNTLIFLLAGVIMGDNLAEDVQTYNHLSLVDVRLMLINYVLTVMIRFAMVAILSPFLSQMGYGMSRRDAVMLSWGGLRGAVGLALAMDVDISFAHESKEGTLLGSRVLFHVSGIASLTLLVNGILSAPLLEMLGLTKSDRYAEALLRDIHRRIHARCLETFNDQLAQLGATCPDDLGQDVKRKCRSLQDEPSDTHSACISVVSQADGKLIAVRQLFLQVLRSEFRAQEEQGIIRHNGQVSIILNEAVDVALDRVNDGLYDFEAAWQRCSSCACGSSLIRWTDRTLPSGVALYIGDFFSNAGLCIRDYTVCYLLRCYIQAHTLTQTKISGLLGQTQGVDTMEEQQVITESAEEVSLAQKAMDQMSPDLVRQVLTGQVTSAVLECERRQILLFLEEGALDGKQAHHLLQDVEDQTIVGYQAVRRASLLQLGDLNRILELSFTRQTTGTSVAPSAAQS